MSILCREFSISRPTGYKIFNCYKDTELAGLNGQYLGEVYTSSNRIYRSPDPLQYPFHDKTICVGKRKINLSVVFAGQTVGITEVNDDVWLVSFMHYDLGFFDEDINKVQPAENPFMPNVLPMSSV